MPVFARQLKALDYHSPEAIKLIANHIRTMQEELEYRLAHLDSSNVSEIDASQTNIITKDGDLYTILNTLEDQQAKLEIGYDHISATVESFSGTVDEYRKEVAQLSATTDELKATVGSYEKTLEGYDERVSTLEMTAETITASVAQNTTTLEGYESKFAALELDVDEISGTVADYKTTLDGYETELSTFSQKVDSFEGSIQRYEKDLEGYTAEVAQFRVDVTGFSGQVSSYTESVNGYKDEVASYKASLDEYSATIKKYEESVAGYSEEVAAFRLSADGFTTEVSNVRQYVDEQTGAINKSLENYSTTTQTESLISSTVAAYVVNYDTNTLSTKYSTITQTEDAISATVTSCNGYTDALANTISTTLSVESDGVYVYQTTDKNYLKLTSGSIELYGSVMGYSMRYLEVEAIYGSYEFNANAASNNYYARFNSEVGNAQMAFSTMSFPNKVAFGSNGTVYFKGTVDFSAASITGSYLTFS